MKEASSDTWLALTPVCMGYFGNTSVRLRKVKHGSLREQGTKRLLGLY